MHPNPAFRQDSEAAALRFAAERGFGVLSVNGAAGPLLAHVPLLLAADGKSAEIHLARSNAIARAGLPAPAVFAVIGPDAYVSPDWYGAEDQVPTWNYVAVHLRGVLEPMEAGAIRGMVEALSAVHEGRLAPKRPWTSAKMAPEALERMLRMILPFRLRIERVEATFKLNQNKTKAMRDGVIAALEAAPGVGGPGAIAALMRGLEDRGDG